MAPLAHSWVTDNPVETLQNYINACAQGEIRDYKTLSNWGYIFLLQEQLPIANNSNDYALHGMEMKVGGPRPQPSDMPSTPTSRRLRSDSS